MADSAVAVTAGTGTNIDTRTEGTNSNHRQVIVIGDPATNAGVAPVDVTNGLAVQVIPALPAGTNAIGKLAANSGVDIGDIDVTSVIPGTGATNLGKAEDAAHTSGDVGVMALAVKRAFPASSSATDGDYVTMNADADGNLFVAARPGGVEYEAVAASQTAQVIGATGAAGDYLSHVIVSPATAGCGVVTILDNATALVSFPGGGTTALSNLIPFVIPVGIKSTSGAWKITTGANVSCVAVGKFT